MNRLAYHIKFVFCVNSQLRKLQIQTFYNIPKRVFWSSPIFRDVTKEYITETKKMSTADYQTETVAPTNNCIVIGIGGVTNGGKTILCKRLLENLDDCHAIFMDDYFLREDCVPVEDSICHGNWEELTALDTDQMFKDFLELHHKLSTTPCKSKRSILILEGFLIFNYRPFVPYCAKKFYLYLPKEECYRRRMTRNYDPPDPNGYFDNKVWPMHLKHRQEIKNQKDIEYIDGTLPKDVIFQHAYSTILDMRNSVQ